MALFGKKEEKEEEYRPNRAERRRNARFFRRRPKRDSRALERALHAATLREKLFPSKEKE